MRFRRVTTRCNWGSRQQVTKVTNYWVFLIHKLGCMRWVLYYPYPTSERAKNNTVARYLDRKGNYGGSPPLLSFALLSSLPLFSSTLQAQDSQKANLTRHNDWDVMCVCVIQEPKTRLPLYFKLAAAAAAAATLPNHLLLLVVVTTAATNTTLGKVGYIYIHFFFLHHAFQKQNPRPSRRRKTKS